MNQAIQDGIGDNAELRPKIRESAAERRQFGHRRVHVLRKRQGLDLNHKKLRRLYGEERLQVRRGGGRTRPRSALENATPAEFVERSRLAERAA